MSNPVISFQDRSGALHGVLDEIAEQRNQSRSELLYDIVISNVDAYADNEDLTPEKRQWIQLQQRKQREKYAQALAKEKKKRNTFVFFISSQIYDMLDKDANADGQDVVDYLERQKTLFENRAKLERYKHMRENYNEYYRAYKTYLKEDNGFNTPELPSED